MWNITFWVVGVIVIGVSQWVYRWRNPKCKRGVLPPGSMGLPLIGESLEFFSSHPYEGIPPFISKRTARYGRLFKTSIVGQPVVVSTDPEVNHYVFNQEEKLFQVWYTKSSIELTGKQGMMVSIGAVHKYLKSLVFSLIGPEKIKEKLLPEIDQITRTHLHKWAEHGEVDVKEAAENMLFIYFADKVLGCDEKEALHLKEHYKAFGDGMISFPLYLPGTPYYKCSQARKTALKIIRDIFKKRRSSNNKEKANEHKDFLDRIIEEVNDDEALLTEETAGDVIFLLIFAAYETTSSSITLLLKYLTEYPDVVRHLKEEHEKIQRDRADKDAPVSWAEYKSMTFTHMVMNETLRLANIAPGIFRRVLKDVEIKGYAIPAGWTVVVCPSSVHLDSNKYDNPLIFNPWRWKGEELHKASKKFMAFGGGIRLCAGADLSKVQTAIFIHYLMKNYRWNVTEKGSIIRQLGLCLNFKNGLRIQIHETERENNEQKIVPI